MSGSLQSPSSDRSRGDLEGDRRTGPDRLTPPECARVSLVSRSSSTFRSRVRSNRSLMLTTVASFPRRVARSMARNSKDSTSARSPVVTPTSAARIKARLRKPIIPIREKPSAASRYRASVCPLGPGRPSRSMTLEQAVAVIRTAEGTRWYAYLVSASSPAYAPGRSRS